MVNISSETDRYLELIYQFPPRIIKSESELIATQSIIDSLLDASSLTIEERDYLNLLGTLVHEYEQKYVPIPDLEGVELLKAMMAELGLKQKDLVPIFKTESIVSAILNGQRKLTVEHIQKLADRFQLSPSIFFARSR